MAIRVFIRKAICWLSYPQKHLYCCQLKIFFNISSLKVNLHRTVMLVSWHFITWNPGVNKHGRHRLSQEVRNNRITSLKKIIRVNPTLLSFWNGTCFLQLVSQFNCTFALFWYSFCTCFYNKLINNLIYSLYQF